MAGGDVMSDEIAAWNPEKNLLESFPRAMAVRPTTFMFVDETERYHRLHLDEEKAIVPLARGQAAVPLRKVVILGWALDEPVASGESICEVNVSAADTQWQAHSTRCTAWRLVLKNKTHIPHRPATLQPCLMESGSPISFGGKIFGTTTIGEPLRA